MQIRASLNISVAFKGRDKFFNFFFFKLQNVLSFSRRILIYFNEFLNRKREGSANGLWSYRVEQLLLSYLILLAG
jgi:hypothetical protein